MANKATSEKNKPARKTLRPNEYYNPKTKRYEYHYNPFFSKTILIVCVGYRPFDKNAPQITIEKGIVFHAEAKGAGRAGVAAERQGRVLAGGILRVGTIQADDSGANAQP